MSLAKDAVVQRRIGRIDFAGLDQRFDQQTEREGTSEQDAAGGEHLERRYARVRLGTRDGTAP